jgi:hypothetical protein
MVSTEPRAPLVKPKSSSRTLNAVLVIAAVVAIGGVSFAIGRTTAPAAASVRGIPDGGFQGAFPGASLAPGESAAPGFPGGGQGGFGGGLTISGTVSSVDGDALVVTTDSGQTVEFTLDGETTYQAKTETTSTAVAPGVTVEVRLDFGAGGQPTASADDASPLGVAASVTVVP